MKVHGTTTAMMALLLALASGQSEAAAGRTLQLDLPMRQQPALAQPRPAAAMRTSNRNAMSARNGLNRNPARVDAPAMRIRDGALQGMLEPQHPAFVEEERGAGQLQLKFHKRGNAFRDLNKSYREMCNNVSAKIWDEPNGKRVRFDVAGKPGFGVEIPIR